MDKRQLQPLLAPLPCLPAPTPAPAAFGGTAEKPTSVRLLLFRPCIYTALSLKSITCRKGNTEIYQEPAVVQIHTIESSEGDPLKLPSSRKTHFFSLYYFQNNNGKLCSDLFLPPCCPTPFLQTRSELRMLYNN